MKKRTHSILSLVLAVLMLMSVAPLSVSAAEYSGECGAEGDNVTWEIDVNTGTLFINGIGDMADYTQIWDVPWFSYRETPGFRCIVVGEGITSIGDNAFISTNVAKITLSSTVKEFGFSPFRVYSDTSIIIDENNPYLMIDDYGVIYSKDGKTLICATKQVYEMPNTVETFAPYAFSISGIPSQLNIPASVKSIPIEAFFAKDAYGVRPKSTYPRFSVDENNPYYSNDEYGVLFDKNKETLYMAPFWAPYATEQTRYFIPETVRRIGDYAFFGYDKESILITENVTEIGSLVFCPFSENSYGFTRRLYIPETVTTLAEDFFINEEFESRFRARAVVYYEGTQEEWAILYKGNKDWLTVYYEHEHANTIIEETCTQKIYTCSGCETVNKIEDIGDNHDWREINRDIDEYPCQGVHIYYSCKNCQAEKIEQEAPTEDHRWGIYDYSEAAYCVGGMIYYYCTSLCGATKEEYIEPLGHNYEYVSDNNATCTEDGTKHEVCERCNTKGETVIDVGSKLGHDLTEKTILSQQSCTQDGISVQACKRCSEITATTESAYGHFDNDGDGKCDECKVVLEVILPDSPSVPGTDASEHTHSFMREVIVAPDCLTAGEQEFTCSCGEIYRAIIPAVGHTDENTDSVCDVCTEDLIGNDAETLDFISKILEFFRKIAEFFEKLFNMA